MMQNKGLWRCETVCAVMLLMLSGCAGASPGNFCSVYRPVYAGVNDSEQTRAEIDGNNSAWLELCSSGP
jgi:hypothetical protein